MSRNAKMARRCADAKTRNRKNGFKGPSRTVKKHTKKHTWYNLLKVPALAAALLAKKQQEADA